MKGKVVRCRCLERDLKCVPIIDGVLLCAVKKKQGNSENRNSPKASKIGTNPIRRIILASFQKRLNFAVDISIDRQSDQK